LAKRARGRRKKSKRNKPRVVRARAVKEEAFFVGIKDPVEIRKELLLGSKDIIASLRKYDRFSAFREEKQKYSEQLKRVMDEILVLNKRLRTHLPKTPLKGPAMPKPAAKPVQKPKAKDKLDILEQELSKVEARLKSLE